MRYFLLPLLPLLFPFVAFGQNTVSGKILDDQNQPLEFANVLLLNASDSSLVKAEMTDGKGAFAFSELKKGAYRLRVVLLGYVEYRSELGDIAASTELPDIQLWPALNTLGAVEVTAKKPFLEQRAGMMVVNVANSITGTDGSTLELLRKVPGMVIVQDQIRLNGRTGVNILIDGRPTNYVDMNELLRDMPAANIERIEVVTQPGAKYDAQGTAGIINIILKKNVNLGLNGSLTVGAGYGQLGKYRASGNLNRRNDRFNFSASAAFNHRTSFEELYLDRQVRDTLFVQRNYSPDLPYSLNLKTGLDYYISEKQTVGANLSLLGSRNNSTDNNQTSILRGAFFPQIDLATTNAEHRRSGYANADVFYQNKLDTAGHELNFDLSVSRYGRDKSNYVSTQSALATFPDRRQELPGGSWIAAAKADYTRPLGRYAKWEAGAKLSRAEVDNDFRSLVETSEGTWTNDATQTNHFVFEEKIAAGYTSFNYQKGKTEAVLGLRYENAQQTGTSLTLDSVQRRSYSNLFPSLSVNVPLPIMSGKVGLAAAYSYRIDRPGYNNLNPFVYYLDPYTFKRGNPFLRPELTHSTSVSMTYEKKPFFNLQWDRSKDVIQLISSQNDSTGAASGYSENFERYDHIGGHLFFPLNFIKNMEGYGGGMLYYDRYRSGLFDASLDQAAWNFTGFLQVKYKFSKRISAEANGWYRGRGVEGLMTTGDLFGVDAGMQFKFWDNKATLRLNCNNLFFKYFSGNMRFANLDTAIQSRWETRVVNASLTWNFGNQHLKAAKKRKGSADDERKRNNE